MNKDKQEAAFRQRVLEYKKKGHSVTETADRYHMTRKTVHKWLKRWDGTAESLEDRSRRPKNSPRKQTEEEIRLVRRKAKKYKWQDHILAFQEAKAQGYKRSFGCFSRTVRKLQELKPKREKKKRKNKLYRRADYPGQKVQVDVKYMPSKCVTDGNKYYQYTAVDECTRWTYRYMKTRGRFSCLDICACFCYDGIVIKANEENNYMPRAAREKSETGLYHIMLRGMDHRAIFMDDEDYHA